MVSLDFFVDFYFFFDVIKLKEEFFCYSINKLLYNSLCVFFFKIFIVIGYSKVDCLNKGN